METPPATGTPAATLPTPSESQLTRFAGSNFSFHYPAHWRVISTERRFGEHGPAVLVAVGIGEFDIGCVTSSDAVTCESAPSWTVSDDGIVLAYYFGSWIGPIADPDPSPSLRLGDQWVESVDGRPAPFSQTASAMTWRFSGTPEYIGVHWGGALADDGPELARQVIDSWQWSEQDPQETQEPFGSGEWRELPDAPIQDGGSATAVWTGTEFIVWGTDGLADGAAYDPATDTWRKLPDGPRGPARYMAAVWTGDVAIAWHGGRPAARGEPDGGIYDPVTDSWSPISPGPLQSEYGRGVAWSGSELLVLSPDMRAAAYDPTTDTWRDLPSPPLAPGGVEAEWTGTEWLVLGFGTDSDTAAKVAAFDPESDTWSELAASPMTSSDEGGGAVWTGESWLWLGWESLAYDRAADQWRTADTAYCPIGTGSAVWTGSVVLGTSGAFDPVTGACTVLPPAPESIRVSAISSMVWTGRKLLLWGTYSGTGDTTTTDGAVFTPAD